MPDSPPPEIARVSPAQPVARLLTTFETDAERLSRPLAATLARQGRRVCLLEREQRLDDNGGHATGERELRVASGYWSAPRLYGHGPFAGLSQQRQQRLRRWLRHLERRFDTLFLDAGDGSEAGARALLLAVAHTLLAISPAPGDADRACQRLAAVNDTGVRRRVYLVIGGVPDLVRGHALFDDFRQRIQALEVDLECAGFLLDNHSPEVLATRRQQELSAIATRLSRLLARGQATGERGGSVERLLFDARGNGLTGQKTDPETAGLQAACHYAALLARKE